MKKNCASSWLFTKIQSVLTAIDIAMRYVDWLLANCCLYRTGPPDDEQQACSKHVEAYY
jgi:hypothetical protein